MDLRSLEAFVWIARLGQFRAAAKKLNVTQPAVSTRIQLLEQELGVRLFDRRAQQVLITPKGQELLGQAESMLRLRERMRTSANAQMAMQGRLRLGVVSGTLIHTWFAQLVKRIHERFPLLTLEIEANNKPDIVRGLARRQLDIALVTDPVAEPGVAKVPLCSYRLGWIVSPALELPQGPLALRDITRCPVITYSRESRPYEVIQNALTRHHVQDARVYTSSSISTTLTMVMGGIGVGTVPVSVVGKELARGRLRLLDVQDVVLPDFDFVAAYPEGPDDYIATAVAKLAAETAAAWSRRASGRAGRASEVSRARRAREGRSRAAGRLADAP